jgi:two-component sensor histidine kinase
MAFHELATNAAKYGAYSQPSGRVAVSWSMRRDGGRRLQIDWSERDGPPVDVPERRGFGTRLIERSIGEDLSGTVAFDYAPAGLRCTIALPLDS